MRGPKWSLICLCLLTCAVEREKDTANKHHWHVWGTLAVNGPHGGCCSLRWHALPRPKPLRLPGALRGYSPWWTVHLVHFPGPSHLGYHVYHEGSPRQFMHFMYFPGSSSSGCGYTERAQSQVGHASSQWGWSQAVTLLADMNHPGSQDDVVSDWQPACNLMGDVVSGTEIAMAPCLPPLAVIHLPLCLWKGVERAAGLLTFGIH